MADNAWIVAQLRKMKEEHDRRTRLYREVERALSCLPDAMPSASSLLKLLDMVQEVLAEKENEHA